MNRITQILILLLLSSSSLWAQVDRIETKRGNESLAEGDIESAINHYKKALEANPELKEARFNLGNAYQALSNTLAEQAAQLENPEEQQQIVGQMSEIAKQAAGEYNKAVELTELDNELNNTQYNLGNAELVGGEIDKSIEAYKEALRKNPQDEEARYNLAYAQKLKQEQEQQQQQQDQQERQEQDQQQEQKEQEPQEPQEQDQQDQEQQEQQQQQQQQEMSKEEAEQLLEALKKQEKDLQEKLNKKKKPAKRVKIEKDW